MVRYLQDFEKQSCRWLWEEAFPGDSATFCDYYFQEKLKDNRILVREEAGELQAMLHLNPYCINVKGHKWQIDYIVGVATRNDCRRRGYMGQILEKMFHELYDEKMPFVFLMPAKKEIYLPYDFVYIFDQPLCVLKDAKSLTHRTLLPLQENKGSVSSPEQTYSSGQVAGFGWRRRLADVAKWMDEWLEKRYQVYGIRDEAYLDRLGKELISEQGKIDLLYDGRHMVGMIGIWGHPVPEQRFLYCEAGYVNETGYKPAIMARIIHLDRFMRVIHLRSNYKSDEMQISLKLHDTWISENDGIFKWTLTKEASWLERIGENRSYTADAGEDEQLALELEIDELTEWLFGYSVPQAAVDFDAMIQSLHGVFLDEVV